MKQVISASRRTDIPAFYLPWFMGHLRQGKIEVANPMNRQQVKTVPLTPREVAWIVFWSRNYSVFLNNYDFFDDYRLFFHFTINPANAALEPDMISPEKAFGQMERLTEIYGPDSVIWRYDPVVFYRRNGELHTNHDIQVFRRFLRRASLMGIQRCYVSVAHLYPKVLKRARRMNGFEFMEPERKQQLDILREMVDLASLYGVQVFSCSNDSLLLVEGLRRGSCINGKLLNRLGHETVSERAKPSRPDCGCTASIDIGDYVKTGCQYHCLYCYARR